MKRPAGIHKKMENILDVFHAARMTNDGEGEERGMALLEEIMQNAARENIRWNYSTGIAGIGCGIQYLLCENYLEGDADEVLCDFDFCLLNAVVLIKHTDLSKATGLMGIGGYFLYRLNDRVATDENISTLKIKCALLNILYILAAKAGMNGYAYPYADNTRVLTGEERRDIEDFLVELYPFKIGNTQIDEILLRLRKQQIPPVAKVPFSANIRKEVTYYSLSDVTFVFPLRVDSEERVQNIYSSLNYLLRNTEAQFLIIEAGAEQQGAVLEKIDQRVSYSFYCDKSPVFHHTYYRNQLIQSACTPIVGVWDADIVVPVEQICEAARRIRNKEAAFALPYEGICYNVPRQESNHFRLTGDENELFRHTDIYSDMWGALTTGGAFLIDKDAYIAAGMENEYFYGWGPEDAERLQRVVLLGLPVYRSPGRIYHLWHPRGLNSTFPNEKRHLLSMQEYLRVAACTPEELANYIHHWPWIA